MFAGVGEGGGSAAAAVSTPPASKAIHCRRMSPDAYPGPSRGTSFVSWGIVLPVLDQKSRKPRYGGKDEGVQCGKLDAVTVSGRSGTLYDMEVNRHGPDAMMPSTKISLRSFEQPVQ